MLERRAGSPAGALSRRASSTTQLGSYAAAEEALRTVVAQAAGRRERAAGARGHLSAQRTPGAGARSARAGAAPRAGRSALLRRRRRRISRPTIRRRPREYFERANALDKGNVASKVRLAQVRLATGDTERGAAGPRGAIAGADASLDAGGPRARQRAPAPARIRQGARRRRALEKKQPDESARLERQGRRSTWRRATTKAARASFEQGAGGRSRLRCSAAYNLARLDLAERNADAARKRYETMLAKDPKNEQAAARACGAARRDAALRRRRSTAAIERAIAANPNPCAPRLALIGLLRQQTRHEGGARRGASRPGRAAGRPAVLEALGATQLAAGETNQAVETFKQRGRSCSRECRCRCCGSPASSAPRRITTARSTSLRKALALQPDLAEAWAALAERLWPRAGRRSGDRRGAQACRRNSPIAPSGYALEGDAAGACRRNGRRLPPRIARRSRASLAAARRAPLLRAAECGQDGRGDGDGRANGCKDHPKDVDAARSHGAAEPGREGLPRGRPAPASRARDRARQRRCR